MKKALKTLSRIYSRSISFIGSYYSRFISWSYKVGGGVSVLPGNI